MEFPEKQHHLKVLKHAFVMFVMELHQRLTKAEVPALRHFWTMWELDKEFFAGAVGKPGAAGQAPRFAPLEGR